MLQTVGLFPVGSPVLLNTGEIGIVTAREPADPERPEVQLVFGAQGQPIEGERVVLATDSARGILWPLTLGPLGVNPVACFFPRYQ